MADETKTKKKKPKKFLRKDWHKKIKLGSKVKKKRKWRAARGRQNKIRLGVKGHQARPKIGYGEHRELRGRIEGVSVVRVENLKDLAAVEKGHGIIIGSVGKKKKEEIIKKAKEMKIKILNKYRKEEK